DAVQIADKHQFPNAISRSQILLGHAQSQLGRHTDGVALIRQGIAGLLKIGTRMGITPSVTWLAEAQEREGDIAEALEAVEEALKVLPEEAAHVPETLRVRGQLWLKQGRTESAEADFHESITLARSMGAKAWELRSTTSLARLLDKQGRRDEARTM